MESEFRKDLKQPLFTDSENLIKSKFNKYTTKMYNFEKYVSK